MAETGPVVIKAPASFDVYTAIRVLDQTITAQDDGAPGVVIDLSAVTFMDNTGLAVVVAALKRFREAGGWLAVAGAGERQARIFRITGMDKVVPMYPAVKGALRHEDKPVTVRKEDRDGGFCC